MTQQSKLTTLQQLELDMRSRKLLELVRENETRPHRLLQLEKRRRAQLRRELAARDEAWMESHDW